MILSLIIIILWLLLGMTGIALDKKVNMNWAIIIYLVLVPVFPFIFHWCGLF